MCIYSSISAIWLNARKVLDQTGLQCWTARGASTLYHTLAALMQNTQTTAWEGDRPLKQWQPRVCLSLLEGTTITQLPESSNIGESGLSFVSSLNFHGTSITFLHEISSFLKYHQVKQIF